MTDLDLGRMSELESPPDRRRPASFWVAVALAAALVTVLTGGLRVYLDSREPEVPTPTVLAVVQQYTTAVNAGDPVRLRAVLAPDAVWVAGGGGGVGAGPYKGEEYVDFQTSLPAFRLETLGDPIVLGNQVAVPSRISAQMPGVFGEGISVYTLATARGTTMITEILWVPAPRYR